MKFIVDENLPSNYLLWNNSSFRHVIKMEGIMSDSDIWQYALSNNLIILTKDTDFYYRYLSAQKSPKIVWFRVGNLRKKELHLFIESIWLKVEALLVKHTFIIADQNTLEAL